MQKNILVKAAPCTALTTIACQSAAAVQDYSKYS